jgi:hypothetical protein
MQIIKRPIGLRSDIPRLLGHPNALRNRKFREDSEDAGGRRVGIKATFDISNEGLLTLLHGLEAGVPLVFGDRLSLRRSPADNGKEAATLRVDLEAAAQWKATGP